MLEGFSFLYPAYLFALLGLPIIWFILRVLPPPPKYIRIPTIRFLRDLPEGEKQTNKTPIWLLILRTVIITLIVIALAQPIIRSTPLLSDSKENILLIIDNSWASGKNWSKIKGTAKKVLQDASLNKKNVYLLQTASEENTQPSMTKFITAENALTRLESISPKPWNSKDISIEQNLIKSSSSIWIGENISSQHTQNLFNKILKTNDLTFYMPEEEKNSLLIHNVKFENKNLEIDFISSNTINNNETALLTFHTENGRVLLEKEFHVQGRYFSIKIEVPSQKILRQTSLLRIHNQNHAGAAYITSLDFMTYKVGLYTPAGKTKAQPFIDAEYYIEKALSPYAQITKGGVYKIIEDNANIIILNDVTSLPRRDIEQLEKWVNNGGVILRFVGQSNAETMQKLPLSPVELSHNIKISGGDISGKSIPKLSSFPEKSPLSDIAINDEITIKKQILPSSKAQESDFEIWARLDNQTPLITAKKQGQGLLIMFHTGASPEWSNLPLSGLYVPLLKRIIEQSNQETRISDRENSGELTAKWCLDGLGQKELPPSPEPRIFLEKNSSVEVSSKSPPCYYKGKKSYALNLGSKISAIQSFKSTSEKVDFKNLPENSTTDFKPILLFIAALLFVCDWVISLILTHSIKLNFPFICIGAVILLFLPPQAHAQTIINSDNTLYANNMYLAMVETSNPILNQQIRGGLQVLSNALESRTSVASSGVVALNPEDDFLGYFPVIYWPIVSPVKTLSEKAKKSVRDYLDHGGMIVFDIYATNQSSFKSDLEILAQSIAIPPLEEVTAEHVLSRSFYLLDSYPGIEISNTVWIAHQDKNQKNNVSPIIVGQNRWAENWNMIANELQQFGRLSRKDELSIRFGINLVMYALTGTYKADQLHTQAILDRMGNHD